jgi:hypothetical protein
MQVQLSGISTLYRYLSRHAWFGTLEAIVLLVAMAYVEHVHWLPFRLVQLQPHPFWIPVVLAASCYGRSAGYLVVAGATLLDAALNWPEFAEQPDFYDLLVANSKNAVMWLVAAALLGRFHERQAQRRSDAESARDRRAEEARVLAERCQTLAREAANLERRVASSGASAAGSVLEVFQKLLRFSGPRSVEGYKYALHLLIGAKDMSVYVPFERGWMALPGQEEADGEVVPAAVCDAVAASEKVLSCMRPAEAELLNGYAAMAACVRDKTGTPIGVVFIREVDPACLTSAGDAAVSLGNFILGYRYLETDVPLLEHALRPKVQLKVVNGDAARGQSLS